MDVVRCILLIVFLLVSNSLTSENYAASSSWAKLQISLNTFCSMPYGNIRVNIYEHSDNNKVTNAKVYRPKYFYAPIALLDHKSAISTFNNVTLQPEMRFRIVMWNQKVEDDVIAYLSDFVGETIKHSQVQVLPLEKVVLANTHPSSTYAISTKWLPYQLNKHQWFSLLCFEQRDCDCLAANMRYNPEQFDNLKLLFSLSSQTSQTKQSTIRLENIASGQMVAKLLQRFQSEKEVLLTAADEKRLLTETTTNVIVETFDDTDVVSSTSEMQIYNMLHNMLVASRLTLTKDTENLWDSVFWNEDNFRPDKISKTMNDFYQKLDKQNQTKMLNSFQKTRKLDHDAGGDFLSMFSAKSSTKLDVSKSGTNTREDMEKLFAEAKEHVEWNGEKFCPKPLSLSRINLGQLRDSQSLHDRNVKVRYTTAILSTPINFAYYSNATVADELLDLQLAVENLKMELQGTITNTTTKLKDTMAEVTKVKNDLYARTRPRTDIGKMPSNCDDLRRMGHTISGFYSIMGLKRMEHVYCNFQYQPGIEGFQTWIGFSDVKSQPVYFYVQKSKDFAHTDVPIPFEISRVNVGGGMDIKTGTFTAPRTGHYFFSFSALAAPRSGTIHLALRMNGVIVGFTYGDSSFESLSIKSLLEMRAGDKIWLTINAKTGSAIIHDNDNHYTHFTGWLLDEDLSQTVKYKT